MEASLKVGAQAVNSNTTDLSLILLPTSNKKWFTKIHFVKKKSSAPFFDNLFLLKKIITQSCPLLILELSALYNFFLIIFHRQNGK